MARVSSPLCLQACSRGFNARASPFFHGSTRYLSHKVFVPATSSIGVTSRIPSLSCTLTLEKSVGAAAVRGTGRPTMEDTYSIIIDAKGIDPSFFGVFDGHGGIAVAEMAKNSFWPLYKKRLSEPDPVKSTVAAYLDFDTLTLAQPKGLFGALKERGVGGSRCGATAATAVLLPLPDGKQRLIAANVGDARVVLSRGGSAIQLTFDHKPDVEAERKRIESRNPTPKKPLVVNVDGTWRVGGLLSLSRAFGDAYLKDWSDGKLDGARGGFGLTAEPDVRVETLGSDDDLIVLGTDGLWDNMTNQEVVDICRSARSTSSSERIAKQLIKMAQERGVTDDLSVIVIFLQQGVS